MSDENITSKTQASAPALDPARVEHLRRRLLSEQNFPLGLLGGIVAAGAGAGIWAGITLATGYQIGFMALGVGLLVGYTVRAAGKGVTNMFGVVSASLSLLGCAVGNLLAVTALAAQHQGMAFWSAVSLLNPALVQELMVAFFSPIDLLFYGIAVYEGYRLAFRQITSDEFEQVLPDRNPARRAA